MLPVAAFGIDAYGNNGLQPGPLADAGVSFVNLYVCQDNAATHGKIATVDTWARLAPFARIMNYEWYEGRCLVPGAAAEDAPLVLRMIDEGRPTEIVAVSCDTNVGGVSNGTFRRPDELPVCAAELAVHQRTYATRSIRLGVYAGAYQIRWLVDNGPAHGLDPTTILWWSPYLAWSEDGHGGRYTAPETHIIQAGGSVIGGVSCDHNRVVRAYSTSSTPTPNPPTAGDDTMAQIWTIGGTLFRVEAGKALWLPGRNPDEVAVAAQMVACYGAAKDLDNRVLRTVYLDGECPSYDPSWTGFKVTADQFRQPEPANGTACQFRPAPAYPQPPTHFTGTVHVPSVPGDATLTINAA